MGFRFWLERWISASPHETIPKWGPSLIRRKGPRDKFWQPRSRRNARWRQKRSRTIWSILLSQIWSDSSQMKRSSVRISRTTLITNSLPVNMWWKPSFPKLWRSLDVILVRTTLCCPTCLNTRVNSNGYMKLLKFVVNLRLEKFAVAARFGSLS